ncbi:hypothetical protein BV20DRAFT_1031266, partial [Pilatotrama ljubarskyi]
MRKHPLHATASWYVTKRMHHSFRYSRQLHSMKAPRPDIVNSVVKELKSFREAGLSVLLQTARAVMLAHIQASAPELLEVRRGHEVFRCSDSFMRKFLRKEMGWSLRKATRAAQKVPANATEQCRDSFARQARAVNEYAIPAELRVNIDQTNIQLQSPSHLTYEQIGAKQVSLLGAEEKCAFTLLVGISASGVVLPFQAIWQGKTTRSCPSPTAYEAATAAQLGFRFEPSMTSTYWSTFPLMQKYVRDILVPYFNTQREELELPRTHRCLLQLDVWSVHRGTEFRTWLSDTYPWIIRDFVPAGCTGL